MFYLKIWARGFYVTNVNKSRLNKKCLTKFSLISLMDRTVKKSETIVNSESIFIWFQISIFLAYNQLHPGEKPLDLKLVGFQWIWKIESRSRLNLVINSKFLSLNLEVSIRVLYGRSKGKVYSLTISEWDREGSEERAKRVGI